MLTALLDRWAQDRKRARVVVLLDVSGSMGDPADPDGCGHTDQARPRQDRGRRRARRVRAPTTTSACASSRPTSSGPTERLDRISCPSARSPASGRAIARSVNDLFPLNGTPLYTATEDTYDDMVGDFDPTRINAVVLLSDGRNEDPNNNDLEALIQHLRAGSEGENAQPVRVFAIAYGGDADLETLRRIAEATNAQVYDASDATTISQVFTAVVSNF